MNYYHYAVISNNIVEDVIVAETQELAESLTGKQCIGYELKDHTSPQPGWTYSDGVFYPAKPHPSLTRWNAELFVWEPPIDYPSDGKVYTWSTSSESWLEQEPSPGAVLDI